MSRIRGEATKTPPADTREQTPALRAYRRTIGERMDELRRERGLSVKAFCASMGWHKSEYSRKYRGQTRLKDDEIVAMRQLLRAPAGWPAVSIEQGLLIEAIGPRSAEILGRLQEIEALLNSRG